MPFYASQRGIRGAGTGKFGGASSYGKSPSNPATSGVDLLQKAPSSPTGFYWIKTANMPNALQMWVDTTRDGGGYDMLATQGAGNSFCYRNDSHWGVSRGLDLVAPRSEQHWIALANYINVNGYSGGHLSDATPVWKGGGGGNYQGTCMRSCTFWGGCCTNDWAAGTYQVNNNASGRWWLRNSGYNEPNGDYTGNGFLCGNSVGSGYGGGDIAFNDGGACCYGANYIVSTNVKT